MKLFTCLLFCLLAHRAFTLRQSRYYGLNAEYLPYYTPITQYDDVQEEQFPPLPTPLLFVENTGVPAIGRNINSNGEGRVFGALFALRTLAANNGLGGSGIVINTPLNLTNFNSNSIPTTAATATTAPAAAAPTTATRFIPYPDPYLQNLQQPQYPGGFRGTFRRWSFPFRRNIYANLPRVQYLRK